MNTPLTQAHLDEARHIINANPTRNEMILAVAHLLRIIDDAELELTTTRRRMAHP